MENSRVRQTGTLSAVPPPPSLGGSFLPAGCTVQHAHGQGLSSQPVPTVTKDRSLRSVFVGNIPYEASEEQLKEVFSEVGPVVSFRLVFDRETGKPKGYGFCEYKDQETAASAMRNLGGRELNGRALRVDSAASEKNREELRTELFQASTGEAPSYGETVLPSDAPEAVTQAVTSLPPEQLYNVVKQMINCVKAYPDEAHQLLVQNPQLSYALLQAQVAMQLIDAETAQSMLYKPMAPAVPLYPLKPAVSRVTQVTSHPTGQVARGQPVDLSRPMPSNTFASPPRPTFDSSRATVAGHNPVGQPPMFLGKSQSGNISSPHKHPAAHPVAQPATNHPRASPSQPNIPGPHQHPSPGGPGAVSAQDKEKAELIMQVLGLTDEQIGLLSPEQQASIRLLKEQVQRAK